MGMTLHPSDGDGAGIGSKAPPLLHDNAYCVAEHALEQAAAPAPPSASTTPPSLATVDPLGTSQTSNLGLGEQPDALAAS
jgi:hypothetical protein